jgi:hypothetical protein
VVCNPWGTCQRHWMRTNIIIQEYASMKTDPLFPIVAAAILAGALLAFANPARAANDTEIDRKGTYTTSNGGAGTTASTTTRSNGAVNRQGTWTNASGGTGTWQSQRTWNPASQTATVNGSATRPNGVTSTLQGTATRTAPGAFTGKGTITLSNGKQYTYSGTDTRTAPGTWERQTTVTTPAGKTVDRNVVTSVSGGNGTRTATTTLPNGKTATNNSAFTQTTMTTASAAPTPTP